MRGELLDHEGATFGASARLRKNSTLTDSAVAGGEIRARDILCPHCLDLLETAEAHERTVVLHEEALGRDLRIRRANRIGGYQTVYRDLL